MSNFYESKIVSTAELIPYANNSRTHNPDQVRQIAASIREFNFTNPVLIDENNTIIAGHGRVMAADLLSLPEVPCIVMAGLTEAQKKAYVIADNQLALNSGWDMDLLRLEVESLKEMDFDIDLMGFDTEFLNDLLNDGNEHEPEPKGEEYAEKLNLVIECDSEEEQEMLYERLTEEGFKCQVQSL